MPSTRADHLKLELVDDVPSWQKPSTCRRPVYLMEKGKRRPVEPREDGWRDSPLDTRPMPESGESVVVFPPPPVEATGFWYRLLLLICGH